ncbi:protein PML isoform X4 [Desmodus rotundus]|uniref:protein PML isoform X4 n=1 Tax=Desmodus rotundus TaxID=9430 RepID=UPI000D17F8A1|nr:protein PML isoform X4 [Desmodus rotundus]
MQQEPAPAGSLGSQQDSALPRAPTMPPPGSSKSHQPSPDHSPTEQATEEEFQFLRCQCCQVEAKSPKLLLCLHTLCSGCLEAPGMQCPICQADPSPRAGGPALDNVFFESLQRRLAMYRQIVDAQAICTRCKETADFWCFECEQLLCAKCFEAHQWFLKHEARPLAELRGQSVCEFLDGTRKSNNIFCSNPNHRSPMLTSIYCQGCAKPLCCSCALLDNSHGHLKCDITEEIQQRQEELGSMTQLLQKQDQAFGSALAQLRSAISQLGRVRTDTEEVIRAGVRQLVAHVLAQESELLEAVNARYQREYEKIAGQLGRLDAVLQRIRTGSVLVQRMKRYASDQEVLDMHDFLRKALEALHREEPQSLKAAVRTDSFDEFKVRLQDLVSCITQGTDAAVPRRASPEATSTPREPFDVNPSFREPDDSSSESSDLQLEGPDSLRALDESFTDLWSEDRPLVFFDLKIDSETQEIRQLAAVNQESKFRVLIQPEAFSIYSKAVSLEVGLQHFLRFLTSMRRPILACYKLWGPSLPNFFRALEDMNRLWEFQETISGFLATLPLIQERVPQASSFKLKSLAKTYLARNMSEHSALAAVLAMRDLCRLLEVSPGPQLAQHVYFFSSLQCFGSLQPLVQAAVLSRAEARLLALHNVSFMELLTTHRRDPQGGLKKYSRYLKATSSPHAQPALNLQALSTYFKGLLEEPGLAQAEGISNPPASHSLAKGASQQS